MTYEQYSLYGGTPPHVADSDTSHEAAVAALPRINETHERILRMIADRADLGATCDEIEAAGHYLHTTASARIRELVLLGRLYDTGERRKTRSGCRARVYRVAR